MKLPERHKGMGDANRHRWLPDGLELGGLDFGVAAHQWRIPGQSRSRDHSVGKIWNRRTVNVLDSFSHLAVKGGQLVRSLRVRQRLYVAMASGGGQRQSERAVDRRPCTR